MGAFVHRGCVMRTWLAVGVALAVGAPPVLARGHSGGHGGGSHSGHGHAHGGGGGSHASGGGHAHARQGGSASSSHTGEHHPAASAHHSSSGSARPPLTDAERRHPRPGTGTGDRFFGRFGPRFYARPYGGFGLGYGYGPGYFDPFFYDYGYDYYGYSPFYGDYGPYSTYRRPSMAPWNEDDAGDDADAAILGLEVRPADASIYVDDEPRGSGREVRRLGLTPGRHRIDVVRPGFRPVTREVEVAPGQARTLEIELEPLR